MPAQRSGEKCVSLEEGGRGGMQKLPGVCGGVVKTGAVQAVAVKPKKIRLRERQAASGNILVAMNFASRILLCALCS